MARKKTNWGMIIGILAVVALVFYFMTGGKVEMSTAGTPITLTTTEQPDTGIKASCPDNMQTTLTLTVYNELNTTGSETFDMTGRLGTQTVTDTTSGSYTINCGEEYTLKFISADGDGGDNSRIRSVKNSEGLANVRVNEDGSVTFTPVSSTAVLNLGGSQHGVLEFRAYDKDAAGWMCNSDDSCSDYETDGVIFESTTNGTAKAIGSTDELTVELDVRATAADTDFNDQYVLILAEAPVATWQEPVLKVNGVKLSDVKGSLTTEEEKQFSSYEYIYKYDGSITDDGIVVYYNLKPNDGVDPSVDPELDFAAAGNYLSVDGVTIKTGAAKDTSTYDVVFTVQDVTFDIS